MLVAENLRLSDILLLLHLECNAFVPLHDCTTILEVLNGLPYPEQEGSERYNQYVDQSIYKYCRHRQSKLR